MASAVLQILIYYSPWTNLLVVLFQAMHFKMRSSPAQQCQAQKITEKSDEQLGCPRATHHMHDSLCFNFKYLTAIASHLALRLA